MNEHCSFPNENQFLILKCRVWQRSLALKTMTKSVSLHLSSWWKLSTLYVRKYAGDIFQNYFLYKYFFLVAIYHTISLYIQVISSNLCCVEHYCGRSLKKFNFKTSLFGNVLNSSPYTIGLLFFFSLHQVQLSFIWLKL